MDMVMWRNMKIEPVARGPDRPGRGGGTGSGG
jgi:hypothetical protein